MGHFFVLLAGWSVGNLRSLSDTRAGVKSELRQRERYLTLLKLTTSEILNPKNPEDKYYSLITRMVNLFVADYGFFFRWDPNREQDILIASTLSVEPNIPDTLLKPGQSVILKSVLQSAHPLPVSDILNFTRCHQFHSFQKPRNACSFPA